MHKEKTGKLNIEALFRKGFPRRFSGNTLFCLKCEPSLSVLWVRRKEVWDAVCGIRDVCSGLRLTIHALRDQIKDIRIQ